MLLSCPIVTKGEGISGMCLPECYGRRILLRASTYLTFGDQNCMRHLQRRRIWKYY
jgi:hypothetical protein